MRVKKKVIIEFKIFSIFFKKIPKIPPKVIQLIENVLQKYGKSLKPIVLIEDFLFKNLAFIF